MSLHSFRIFRQCSQLASLRSLQPSFAPSSRLPAVDTGRLSYGEQRRNYSSEGDKPRKERPEEASGPGGSHSEAPAGSSEDSKSSSDTDQQPQPTSDSSPEEQPRPPQFSVSEQDKRGAFIRELHDQQLHALAQRTVRQTVEPRDPPLGLFRGLSQAAWAWVTRSVVKYYIETDLDEPQGEFLRGAADAFETVNELLYEKNWEQLKEMVSSSVLKAFRELHEDHLKHKLTLTMYPAENVTPAYAIFTPVRREAVKRYDKDIEDEEPPADPPAAQPVEPVAGAATAALDPPSPFGGLPSFFNNNYSYWAGADHYLLARVAFQASLKSEVKKDDGQVVLEVNDKRTQQWVFARGPLPADLPHRELQLKWKLLTIL